MRPAVEARLPGRAGAKGREGSGWRGSLEGRRIRTVRRAQSSHPGRAVRSGQVQHCIPIFVPEGGTPGRAILVEPTRLTRGRVGACGDITQPPTGHHESCLVATAEPERLPSADGHAQQPSGGSEVWTSTRIEVLCERPFTNIASLHEQKHQSHRS
jgi:hypothetical protein